MKIVSINPERTKDECNVAFNVDQAPRDGLLARVNYGYVSLSIDGLVLIARMPKDSEPVSMKMVGNLNALFQREEQAMVEAAAIQDEKRERMLARIAEQTGLPIDRS